VKSRATSTPRRLPKYLDLKIRQIAEIWSNSLLKSVKATWPSITRNAKRTPSTRSTCKAWTSPKSTPTYTKSLLILPSAETWCGIRLCNPWLLSIASAWPASTCLPSTKSSHHRTYLSRRSPIRPCLSPDCKHNKVPRKKGSRRQKDRKHRCRTSHQNKRRRSNNNKILGRQWLLKRLRTSP